MKQIKCPYCDKHFYVRTSEENIKIHCCPNVFCKKIIEVKNEVSKVS